MTSTEHIIKRLEVFIKVRSTDSILTHLTQIFLFKHQEKICGSFRSEEIKIWISNNAVIGAFYPVIQLKFDETNNKITIKSKMNQAGLGKAFLINLGIIWASLNMFILNAGFTSDSLLQRIIFFVFFVGIFNFPVYKCYTGARDVLIKEVEEIIQVEKPLT